MPFRECSNCGALVDDSNNYCPKCGAPLYAQEKKKSKKYIWLILLAVVLIGGYFLKREYDSYKYHYINQDNITYLCMTSNFPEDIAFGFLIDVQKQFIETYDYDKILSATSYLLENFQEKLKKLMAYYNTCPQKTQTGQIIKDLIDAKSTAVENIEKLISRDQKLNIIVAKSDALNTQSRNINNIAQKIKTQQKLKKMRNMRLIIGAVIIFVILHLKLINV